MITYRDIGHFRIPHVTEEWMDAAASSSLEEPTIDKISELFFSNELVDELLVNDRYLISTPILNFTIPSTLKTYIDLIVRNGLTTKRMFGNTESIKNQASLRSISRIMAM
jgi:FMN-dependent NADH-azoreductase